MRKKCTASNCRKVFNYHKNSAVVECPFCGKKYPRLGDSERVVCIINGHVVDVDWLKYEPHKGKVQIIKKLRKQLEKQGVAKNTNYLKLAKNIIDYYFANQKYPAKVFVKVENGICKIS